MCKTYLEEQRQKLLQVYWLWEQTLCPLLRTKAFSYPYYLNIPDHWYESTYRILIVGEEGRGKKQYDLPIEKVQEWIQGYLSAQLNGEDRTKRYKKNGSRFWRRVQEIDRLFEGISHSIVWTNLDKIHHSGTQKCTLSKRERERLHNISILSKEIEILNPTHVIYFGWYGYSLQQELPDVCNKLYPKGLSDHSEWKTEKMAKYVVDGRHHIFTYHPNWRRRPKDYEEKFLNLLRQTITD
ncbi:hypothetical protein H6A12_11690 [Phocea massiliensis]|uniref:Uracil-DNA glycosylase-like domain-containing protein n=1 Tax=Merdimmobilis hominis TaxID=2897707 RepID=A0A938X7V7_9FIRM|nr:hypothetical protein [Merdimmobilis hominis]MBM6921811.1 hypothetical protein [Merdimmobilis hominis]